MLHVQVHARLLRVHADLDRIVNTPTRSSCVSLGRDMNAGAYAPLDRHEDIQKARRCRAHGSEMEVKFREEYCDSLARREPARGSAQPRRHVFSRACLLLSSVSPSLLRVLRSGDMERILINRK